jgi:hypothetical protein
MPLAGKHWIARVALVFIPTACVLGGILGMRTWLTTPFDGDNLVFLLVGLSACLMFPSACMAGAAVSALSFLIPERGQLLSLLTCLISLVGGLVSARVGKQISF